MARTFRPGGDVSSIREGLDHPGPPAVLEDVEVLASGLLIPEGPVAMPDGSVLFVEIGRGTVSRVTASGELEVIADCGGGPNGLAIGGDGAAYVCNNGGPVPTYTGGRIERLDLESGDVTVLYGEFEGKPLSAPNDLVFDGWGGFWFTDMGKRRATCRDHGRLFYAKEDGSDLRLVFPQLDGPNGVGLSADGNTLYFTETWSSRLYRRGITEPGCVEHGRPDDSDSLICGLGGLQWFDSLAVDHRGYICVGTLQTGCITVVSPDGSVVQQLMLPPHQSDHRPTNICFTRTYETAYITLAETGRLVRCRWQGADYCET
jgi:gluconolactonase